MYKNFVIPSQPVASTNFYVNIPVYSIPLLSRCTNYLHKFWARKIYQRLVAFIRVFFSFEILCQNAPTLLLQAGDLFSVSDEAIVNDLTEVLNTICDITSSPDYVSNDNDQSVVEICITRVTSAIR